MPAPRFYVPLLGAAALVYAIGPQTMASERQSTTAQTVQAPQVTEMQQKGDALSPALAVAVSEQNDVRLALHVVNNSKRRVEVRFPNARTHDFSVIDSSGREVWRWSEGRMFTQTMQNRVVGARETITFDASWKPAHAGRYTAVARLVSANHPLQARAAFLVR